MDISRLAGTRLSHHVIEHLLGSGCMGVVYKARQISIDRPVALKILLPAFSSDSSFVKRFQREARAVARLSHPNIVQVFDIVVEEGLYFFGMEYIEGETSDEVFRQRSKRKNSGQGHFLLHRSGKALDQPYEGLETDEEYARCVECVTYSRGERR